MNIVFPKIHLQKIPSYDASDINPKAVAAQTYMSCDMPMKLLHSDFYESISSLFSDQVFTRDTIDIGCYIQNITFRTWIAYPYTIFDITDRCRTLIFKDDRYGHIRIYRVQDDADVDNAHIGAKVNNI